MGKQIKRYLHISDGNEKYYVISPKKLKKQNSTVIVLIV